MKKILVTVGVFLFAIGVFVAWRTLNPPLSDEAQIMATLHEMEDIARRRNWRRLKMLLADDFQYGNLARKDVLRILTTSGFQYASIDLRVSGVKINAGDESAVAHGHYTLTLQADSSMAPQPSVGDFKLTYTKENGTWLVRKMEGGNISQF